MGDTEIEFIKQFHNLEGSLISERKKNFFKLLQNKSLIPNEEQLDVALKNLKPKTYLESLLRIDMLIHFRKNVELLEVLKEGNEVFISKIIKHPWFFEETFKETSADEFVSDFLPCTSYAIRMKVLKRISATLNETQMDELFECVLRRYGLQIASNILHSCSPLKINEVLSNYDVHLRPNQVKALFDKDLILFKSYLKRYKDIKGCSYDEKHVFKYVACKNPQILMELKKEEKLNTRPLGRRLSKKIMNLVKGDVIKDVTLYISLLNHNVIVRQLGGDFKNVFFDLFPRKLEEMYINKLCFDLFRLYPKRRQWDLFAETFTRVFDSQNVTDNLDYLTSSIVNLCPDKKIRQKWAEIKYNLTNDNSFLTYYEPKKLFVLIKEKINVSSQEHTRLDLLKLMIKSCEYYNDLVTLEKMLKYFCFRHRNESSSVRKDFMYAIRCSIPLENLSENHWKYINELINLSRIEEQYNYYNCLPFSKKYLEFLFKNGKPFRNELLQFVKEAISNRNKFWPEVKNGAIEREILIQIVNIIPDIVNKESEEYAWVYQKLIHDIVSFSINDSNTAYCIRISDFPNLVTFIEFILHKTIDFKHTVEWEMIHSLILYNHKFPQNAITIEKAKMRDILLGVPINQYNSYFKGLLEQMLKKKSRSELENEMLHLYFNDIIDKHISHSISFWFLRHDPDTIIPYIKKVVTIKNLCIDQNRIHNKENRMNTLYLKAIKLYSHLHVDAAFIVFLRQQLDNPDCESKEEIIKFLSILLPTDGYIDVITKYFEPKKVKLDLKDEEMKLVYRSQCEAAKTLKNVIEPAKMLPTVIKFCIGDYLQSALRSLYSIFYRSPEKQLYFYIDVLSTRAMSVQKHAVFLSCACLDHNYVLNMLKSTKQINVSSQKHIFSATLKYFLRNQSQELLDLLISNMSTIDQNDTETFNSLTSIEAPKKFKVLYIEKCWRFFESVRQNVMIDDYLRSLLHKINDSSDIITSLSSGFCRDLIINYFKQQIDDLLHIELYVCKVLRYRETEQMENFDFVFGIISTFKADNKIELITKFFKEFYMVSSQEHNPKFVGIFRTYWQQLFTPVEMFDQYVLLTLLNIKYESNNPFVENYAKNVVTFLEHLIAEYGLYIYKKFKLLLKQALHLDFDTKAEKYLFFYSVLKTNVTPTNCILVLDLMDKVYEDTSKYSEEDKEILKVFYDILKILGEVEEPIVRVCYNSYVKKIC